MKLKNRYSFKILLIIINLIFEIVLIGASDQGDSSQIPRTAQAFTVAQRLDHFNKSETRLWGQRYFVSGQYYTGDGPVFVLVGGDVVATISWLTKKYQWTEWAERFNALCFYVEQRFFGESQPTGDLSLDSLKYFTLNQALEDLVDFRASMEYQYKLNNKQWIFFGNVNGALLATNLRIKYPGLVTGVVASCPRMIFKLNNSDLLSAAFKVLDKASPTCVPAIANAVQQIQDSLNDGPDGWADLTSKFQYK